MEKTTRRASNWMETRFKLGDTRYPEENETHYFNGRYQNKMRNGTRSYYSEKIDPLSYKVSSWRVYGRDTKIMAKRAARRNAKILIKLETFIIMDEIWQDEQALMWEDDDWYGDNYIKFNFNYSDEAREYAEQHHLEELNDLQDQNDWWSAYDTYYDYEY